jgi:uncharacterized protein (DUF433 family)
MPVDIEICTLKETKDDVGKRAGIEMSELLARITVDPERMHGRPCIRNLRVTVSDVLNLLAAGQSRESILRDYPYLEEADIDAVLAFAAR